MAEDWFRKISWTEKEKNDFFARLKRARPSKRSQYIRIQALHLAEGGATELIYSALDLLELLFDEYPDRLQLASAYLQKAECLRRLGMVSEAITYFKKSINFQREFPNVRTNAVISLGLTVIENQLKEEYKMVLSLLNEFEEDDLLFPVRRFQTSGIRSIILSEMGDSETAKIFAERALVETERTHSGLWKHPKLGLVGLSETKMKEKLKKILMSDRKHGN